MREDELIEAWQRARDKMTAARAIFERAQTELIEARQKENIAWRQYVAHIERHADQSTGSADV